MGTQSTPQALRLLGIVSSSILVIGQFLLALDFYPFLYIPLIWFCVGILLPIILYTIDPEGNHLIAGVLIIGSGICSLFYFLISIVVNLAYSVFLIGGGVLIATGGAVASYSSTLSAPDLNDESY